MLYFYPFIVSFHIGNILNTSSQDITYLITAIKSCSLTSLSFFSTLKLILLRNLKALCPEEFPVSETFDCCKVFTQETPSRNASQNIS